MAFVELYVDGVTGNDSYDGTSATVDGGNVGPKKTIFAAAGAVSIQAAGTRINVKNNATYVYSAIGGVNVWAKSGVAGTVHNPIVWRGYETTPGDGGQVTIRSAFGNVTAHPGITFTYDPGVWYCENFIIEGNTGGYGHLLNATSTSTIVFKRCKFKNFYAGSNDYGNIFTGETASIRCYECTFIVLGTHADCRIIAVENYGLFVGCFVETKKNGINIGGAAGGAILNSVVIGNNAANTYGIYAVGDDASRKIILNNTVNGFGNGIDYNYYDSPVIMNNLLMNCTNAIYFSDPFTTLAPNVINNKALNCTNQIVFATPSDLPEEQFSVLGAIEDITGTPLNVVGSKDYRMGLTSDAAQLFQEGFPFIVGAGAATEDGYAGNLSVGAYGPHDWPAATDVRESVDCAHSTITGTLDLPSEYSVRDGLLFDNETKEGAMVLPAVEDVRDGTLYDSFGDGEQMGTLDLPLESTVQSGVQYDNTTKTGTYAPGSGTVPRDLTFEDNSDVVS